jgi:RNA polymerase sigma-70 factor, ECF subfamily
LTGHVVGMRQAPSLAEAISNASSSASLKPRGDGHVFSSAEAGTAQATLSSSAPSGMAQSDSPSSFAQAYEAHFDFVWRSARRLGVPDASIDDVVQDVFVTVYRRLGEFEGRSQLRTWIFGILRHTVRDLRRTQRRKPTEAFVQEPEAPGAGPHEATLQREATRLLHAVLESLDDDQREIFVLAELEQMSAPDIGLALEMNVNTVYSRLRAARLSFEAALKRLRSREQWMMRSGGCDE